VSLVEASVVDEVTQRLIDGYRVVCGLDTEVFVCSPSDGARLVALTEAP
jgi:galactokinase